MGPGAIYLDLIQGSQIDWYFDNDVLGLTNVNTMSNIMFNDYDTLITEQCGNYIIVIGIDTTSIFIGCPLGSSGIHGNVRPCHGDANGMLERTAHSGTPPYVHQWFDLSNNLLQSDSSIISTFDSLVPGSYIYSLTDSLGCDTIYPVFTIGEPDAIIIDTLSTTDVNCRGDSTGSINFSIGEERNMISSLIIFIIFI